MSILIIFFLLQLLSNLQLSKSQIQNPKIIRNFSVSDRAWTPGSNQILLSPNSTFAAGFLPLLSSPNLYTFSVWYYGISKKFNLSTVVWSANDNSSVTGSGSLIISSSGQLSLSNPGGKNLWPVGRISNSSNKTVLLLQETGNLAFGDWGSFLHPTNTILPNQTINDTSLSTRNGKYLFLDSDKLVYKDRAETYWSANALLKLDDLGMISQNTSSIISSDFGDRKTRRLTLDEDGNLRLYSFDPDLGQWTEVWKAVGNLCRIKGTCGAYAICSYEPSDASTSCECLPGFREINSSDNIYTCERKIPIGNSGKNSKFMSLDYVSFTAGTNYTTFPVSTLSECQDRCLGNQTCEGFQFKYDGSNICLILNGTMKDGLWSPEPGNDDALFLRLDESETDIKTQYVGMTDLMELTCPVTIKLPTPPKESNATTRNIVIISTLFAAELLSGAFFFWAFLKKYIKYRDMARTFGLEVLPSGGPKRFSYAELRDATKNFSDIIGKGGFGVVYKGTLSDGRIVAVKSLKNVTGGDPDFWAEVTIIARMHHLNLVRLWGFCTEKGNRLLVYEYVPNGSLDKFLFQNPGNSDLDQSHDMESGMVDRKPILDWNIRFRIALGVARAIAYLHEECLEWVLHCDIKPENILLGEDFCPKVSDFGLAKLKKKEDVISKSRLRGTPGYVAPEWLRPEPITSKSDVYSFGLVLLEMVTGTRNREQQNQISNAESTDWYFPCWAFDQVFIEMNVDDILDPRIKHSYDSRAHFDMVNRMLMTAMWCIQDRAENRPTMGKVAKMLEGTVEIGQPKKPSLYSAELDDE